MGEHEGKPLKHWLVQLGGKVAVRAKAFVAGISALVLGELVVLLTSPDFTSALNTVVPPQFLPFLPLLLGAVVGLLTHQVPNAPEPTDP